MPPKNQNAHTWTTPEQRAFLNVRLPEYIEIHSHAKPKYITFWAQLREAWFKEYPEIQSLFPDIATNADLSVDQRKELTKVVQVRIDVSRYLL